MTEINITIDDREFQRMRRVAPKQIRAAMRLAMGDSTALILRDLKTYPPDPPSSTYRRTKTLGRSWSRTMDRNGMSAFVGSNGRMAPYNRWVMDRDQPQARIHQGRWQTVQSVRDSRVRDVREIFRRRLRMVGAQ